MTQLRIRALGANPGAASGPLYTRESAIPAAGEFILVRPDLGAEDAAILGRAKALVLTRSGLTGDGAIMARALGKPCIAGASMIRMQGSRISVVSGPVEGAPVTDFEEGVMAQIDGKTGEIVLGDS